MAHAQKPDLVFPRNGRVHFNRRGRQFSRLLAAEERASAVVMVVMLDTPCSAVQCKTAGYPLNSYVSPTFPLPCVTVSHQDSTELYFIRTLTVMLWILFISPCEHHCTNALYNYIHLPSTLHNLRKS